jgi:electron transfer flavoprotein alpha subunit
MIGVRPAGTIVGINPDPNCELWDWCDIGVISEWSDVLESLVKRLCAIGINA